MRKLLLVCIAAVALTSCKKESVKTEPEMPKTIFIQVQSVDADGHQDSSPVIRVR